MTKRDRIQTTGIVILAVLSAALVVLVRVAQIAHVQF
jgi:hypothetical protein